MKTMIYLLVVLVIAAAGCKEKVQHVASNTPVGDYDGYEVMHDLSTEGFCVLNVYLEEDGDHRATITNDELYSRNSDKFEKIAIYYFLNKEKAQEYRSVMMNDKSSAKDKKRVEDYIWYRFLYCPDCTNTLQGKSHKGYWEDLKSYY